MRLLAAVLLPLLAAALVSAALPPEPGRGQAKARATKGLNDTTTSSSPSKIGRNNKTTQTNVRLLCWVLSVDTREHNLKSRAIEETWGARCDKLLVIKNGTEQRESGARLTVTLAPRGAGGVPDGRHLLWRKVAASLAHIGAHHLNQFDWFYKADDDTYLLPGALRRFLARAGSPREPVYFGHRFRPYVRQGYMSGGAGYALSREALRRLLERGFGLGRHGGGGASGAQPAAECAPDAGHVEDVVLGRCLEACGVRAGDSRDPNGRETFLPLPPELLLSEPLGPAHWYRTYAYYPRAHASPTECCSDEPVAFHYISPREMRLLDWLLYRVKRATV